MKPHTLFLVGAGVALALFGAFKLGQTYQITLSSEQNATASTAQKEGSISTELTAEDTQTEQSDTVSTILDSGDSIDLNTPIERLFVQQNGGIQGGLTQNERETITVYQLRNEGVVNISTEVIAYNWFFEPIPQQGTTGSGSIIDGRGHVLTNYHVIKGATSIRVTLADNTSIPAEVVGIDAENDLAVLYFNPQSKRLSPIPLGSSAGLQIGQQVLAIGNPFGLDRTLTVGIVSGLGRPIRTDNNLVINNMIQTDASINPGNSGGPLLDSRGNIVGINTMIYTPSGGSVGVGFAVPVDTARRVIPDLINYGFVKRGWIDIVPRQLFPRLVEYAKLPVDRGILVSRVIQGGNADKIGIKGGTSEVYYGNTQIYLGGDIIIEVDNTSVESIANFYEALEDNKPGERISITVVHSDGTKKVKQIVLSERPQELEWE